MLGHLTWGKVKSIKDQLDSSQDVTENTVFVFNFTLRNQAQKRKVHFKNFEETLWRLFDHQLSVDDLIITRQDGTIIYEYRAPNATQFQSDKPSDDGGESVKTWKSKSRAKQNVALKMMFSQLDSYLKSLNGND